MQTSCEGLNGLIHSLKPRLQFSWTNHMSSVRKVKNGLDFHQEHLRSMEKEATETYEEIPLDLLSNFFEENYLFSCMNYDFSLWTWKHRRSLGFSKTVRYLNQFLFLSIKASCRVVSFLLLWSYKKSIIKFSRFSWFFFFFIKIFTSFRATSVSHLIRLDIYRNGMPKIIPSLYSRFCSNVFCNWGIVTIQSLWTHQLHFFFFF